jgi:hypothetical protein
MRITTSLKLSEAKLKLSGLVINDKHLKTARKKQ